jgi:membrane protein implicated in regulation of membrane protease activity
VHTSTLLNAKRFGLRCTSHGQSVKLCGMMLALRIVGFVVIAILVCVLLPFLAVQQPILAVLVVAGFLYWFSRRFAQRKRTM